MSDRPESTGSTKISVAMIDAGYEAIREVLPIELRPPHGPISVDDLIKMAVCAYTMMEKTRRAGR